MRGPFPGASDAWHNAPEPAASVSPEPAVLWSRYAEAQRWPVVNSSPFTTRGHEPERAVDVRANEVARAAYVGLVTDTVFANGAGLIELPHSPGADNGLGMLKEDGGWQFIELDARGGVLGSGAPSRCVRCHIQAPSDEVFGLPLFR